MTVDEFDRLFLRSSTELLVVHLCGLDESVTCSALLDMNAVTESRYPSNTQVDVLEEPHLSTNSFIQTFQFEHFTPFCVFNYFT